MQRSFGPDSPFEFELSVAGHGSARVEVEGASCGVGETCRVWLTAPRDLTVRVTLGEGELLRHTSGRDVDISVDRWTRDREIQIRVVAIAASATLTFGTALPIEAWELVAAASRIRALACAPDGTLAYATSAGELQILESDGSARHVFSPSDGVVIEGPPGTASFGEVSAMAFSPDGALLYAGDFDNSRILAIDASSGEMRIAVGSGLAGSPAVGASSEVYVGFVRSIAAGRSSLYYSHQLNNLGWGVYELRDGAVTDTGLEGSNLTIEPESDCLLRMWSWGGESCDDERFGTPRYFGSTTSHQASGIARIEGGARIVVCDGTNLFVRLETGWERILTGLDAPGVARRSEAELRLDCNLLAAAGATRFYIADGSRVIVLDGAP